MINSKKWFIFEYNFSFYYLLQKFDLKCVYIIYLSIISKVISYFLEFSSQFFFVVELGTKKIIISKRIIYNEIYIVFKRKVKEKVIFCV